MLVLENSLSWGGNGPPFDIRPHHAILVEPLL